MTKRRSLLPAISSATTSSNNRNNAHYARRRRRLLALQLLLSHGTHSNKMGVASACNFYYSMSCQGGYPYTATNTLTIESPGSYEATVTYHWTKANTQLGSISLNDQQTLDGVTYEFFELGEYYAGATVEWGSGSGCEGSSSDSYSLITFSGSSCNMKDGVTPPDYLLENGMTSAPGGSSGTGGTAEPTSGGTQFEMTDPPSKQSSTLPPTAKKVVTPSPTRRPTNKPVVEVITSTPSLRPVFVPDTNTASPTDKGTQYLFSNAPTDAPSAALPVTPTSAPFTDVIECGNDVCQSSEDSVVCAPDCKGVELVSPDFISSDVATISQEGVYFTIESDRDIIVTGMVIYPSDGNGAFENGVTVYARHGEVGYDTLMANEGNVLYSTTNSLSGSDEMTGGAKIKVYLPMHGKTATSIYILAGNGGSSGNGGVQCLTRLGEGSVGDGTLFINGGTGVGEDMTLPIQFKTLPIQFKGTLRYDVVNSLTPYPSMSPNLYDTTSPTYTSAPTMIGGGIGGETNPSLAVVDKSESSNNIPTVIAAGATAGVCAVIVTLAIGMFVVRKKKRESTQQSKSTHDLTPDRVGLEVETDSETLYQQHQPQSYFGTIHKKEGEVDDISTLGDPYMGDAVNARMDADNTVGESMVSNQQQLYIYGVGKPGADVGTASRMGESTVFSGSKVMMFGDDTALEDIYQTPTPNGGSTLDLITVTAPAGPLGIVLDNPHGALPYVYAIKETSALHGRVRVGDLLLSVDEVDCRGMSSHTITRFLSSRSANLERKLVLARGNGMDHDGSTASAV